MAITRREFTLTSLMMLVGALPVARAQSAKVTIVLAPSNLGLRPEGRQPGTWQAPQTLIDAGLQEAVHATQVVRLERPPYEFGAQKGTRIRNGQTIRAFSMQLSHVVQAIIAAGEFPLVIGGDCSVLLGGLYGLRLAGIAQFTVQRALREGVEATAERTIAQLAAQKLDRVWLHVDLDVLDERVMAAVDSPGRPGLNFDQLAGLVGALCASSRIAGADFAIYDPDRDPHAKFAAPLVRCIANGIRSVAT